MAYFLSPSLAQLRSEINALWPHRDRASDGWIGDLAHSARISDHNPDDDDDSINAFDFDKDGIDVDRVLRAVFADRRVNYVIWAGGIYRRANGFRRERYFGINGHYHHIHISIYHGDFFEDNRSPWGLVNAISVSNPVEWTGTIIPPQVGTLPANLISKDTEMALIQAPDWGIALVGPGFRKDIGDPETVYALQKAFGIAATTKLTGREFELVANACTPVKH